VLLAIKMKYHKIILIIIWSSTLITWTLAIPPSGIPGATFGGLFGSNTGDIGIKTASPTTALDVNGTTTIRKSLDMANNKIINVMTPISNTDAVNKAYIDAQTNNMASSTSRLWGQGRPGSSVLNNAGECVSNANNYIKVSRSGNTAVWDGARAACPANWWVCSAAERGTGACGTGTQPAIICNPASTTAELYDNTVTWAWVSDVASTNDRMAKTATTASGTNTAEQYACNIAPVWCCSY